MATSKIKNNVNIADHNGTTAGLQLAGTLVTATAAELNIMDGVTATAAELTKLAGVAAGTVTASKAVVVGANKEVDTLVIADGGLKLGSGAGTAVTATADEINNILDASVSTETRTGAGAISTTTVYTSLVTTAADALTLAAPGAATLPRFKVIHMTTDGGDGTLASTNIVGQSAGTTSITFNDAGDYLVLVAIPGLNKWSVVKEGGVVAA